MSRSPQFLLLVFLSMLLSACLGSPPEPIEVGAVAPSFELPQLEGGELASSSLLGKPVVLNFWATWCQPCWREIPELNELSERDDVQVVSVALDEEGERAVEPFVADRGIRYTVLLGNQEIFERYDGLTIPHTLVLDEAGAIVAIHRGPVMRATLEQDLGLPGAAEEPERSDAATS